MKENYDKSSYKEYM